MPYQFSCWFETIWTVDETFGNISFIWEFYNQTTGDLINRVASNGSETTISNTISTTGLVDMVVVASNGGNCDDCTTSGTISFIAVQRITGLSIAVRVS